MWTLEQIAQNVKGKVLGDGAWEVNSVATLKSAKSHQVSFLANSKYTKYLESTNAGAVLVTQKMAEAVTGNAIIV